MAIQKSEVELVLKARQQNVTKTVSEVSDSIEGLIADLEKAEGAFGSNSEKVEKLRATLDKLSAAERDLIGKGSLIERFKSQEVAVTKADATFKKLSTTAKGLRVDLKALAADDPGRSKLQTDFEKASQAAQKAGAVFRKQRNDLNKTRKALAGNGIEARKLASEEQRLVLIARQVNQAHDAVATSMARVKAQTSGAGGAMRRFGKDSRNSLSVIRRLRGEVLGLATAYVGLFGVGREVGNIFSAVRQKEAIESRFRVAFEGDPAAVAREMQFIEDTADRLKISLLGLGTEYSKFIASIPEGLFTLKQQRKIFVDIATGARVMRLSTEEVAGTFKAIIQIASKGQFQMEELRGQLGDRLPGALLLFAKGMKVSTRELDKMVENGEVGADKLTVLADVIRDKFGGDLGKALAASTTQLAFFLLEVEKLRLGLGQDTGLVDVLGKSLHDVAVEIQKPAFKEGLLGLAELMGSLARGTVWVVKNLDLLKSAFVGFVGAKVLGGVISAFIGARKAMLLFGGTLRSVGVLSLAASGPAGWITALVVALGYLAINSREVALDLDALEGEMKSVADAGEDLADGVNNVSAALQNSTVSEYLSKLELITPRIRQMQAAVEALTNASKARPNDLPIIQQLKTAQEELRRLIALQDFYQKKIGQAVKADLSVASAEPAPEVNTGLSEKDIEKLDKAIDQANKKINELQTQTFAQKVAAINAQFDELAKKAGLATDAAKRTEQLTRVEEARATAIKAVRLTAEKSLNTAVDRLEQGAAKRSARTLQDRLNNIDAQYRKAIERAKQLGKTDIVSRLENLVASEQSAEIDRTKDRVGKALQEIRNADESDLDVRLEVIRQKYFKLLEEIKGNPLFKQEAIELTNDQSRAEDMERLKDVQQQISDIEQERADRLAHINLLREAGLIGETEAQQQIREELGLTDIPMQALLDKAIAYAQALGDENLVAQLERQKEALTATELALNPVTQKAAELTDKLATGLGGAFVDFVAGVKSAKDAFLGFARSFLTEIAKMIAKNIILNALKASGPYGAIIGGVAKAAVAHTGGVVGEGFSAYRSVPPLAFVGAPRYHKGGVAGLAPSEVPIIAQKGEEILTANDPRHRANGGMGGSDGKTPVNLKIVNAIDSGSVVSQGLATADGEEGVINVVRANRSSIKSILDNG